MADETKVEVLRLKMENLLVEMRDSRIFVLNNNGLTIRERDGRNSDIIRLGTGAAIATILDWSEEYDRDQALQTPTL